MGTLSHMYNRRNMIINENDPLWAFLDAVYEAVYESEDEEETEE